VGQRQESSRTRACTNDFVAKLVEEGGLDLRGQKIDPFYVADITGASCLEVVDGQLNITIWKPGEGERSRRLA
jgi:hypothetical protein